jgi:hypothetical protein
MYGAEIYGVEDGWKASDIIRGRCYRGIIIIIMIIIIISCHRFSFLPGTSALEPVVNPTTQASSLSL